jgi:small conductance mechanosensitive channel
MDSVTDALRRAGTDTLHNVGVVATKIPTFLVAIVIILISAWIAQFVGRLVMGAEKSSPHLDPSLRLLIRQLIVAGIVTFGVAVSFGVLGVSFATIVASFGVAGLIVGFALKDLLENFVAGVLILWRRPFEIGDQIQVGTNAGTVSEINFRSTTLRTGDGIAVLIPNAQVFNQAIQNFTDGGSRRTTIVVPLPSDTDLARAESTLLRAVQSVRGVLEAPAPEVLLLGLSATDVQLHVRYWTAPEIQVTSRIESAVRAAIANALTEVDLQRVPNSESDGLSEATRTSRTSNT